MVYELKPETFVTTDEHVWSDYAAVVKQIRQTVKAGSVTVVDCYPGVDLDEIQQQLVDQLGDIDIYRSDDYALDTATVTAKIAPAMTEDRVFGVMTHWRFEDFFPKVELEAVRQRIRRSKRAVVVYGTAAMLLAPDADMVIYADITRWEIQLRYRGGMCNWKADNPQEDNLKKVKRGYFFEWRLGDRHRHENFDKIDYYMDTSVRNHPRMVSKRLLQQSLDTIVKQPFRLVPYFDESVWGGQWMKEKFGLDASKPNYGWAFDGVPEENSLRFNVDGQYYTIPGLMLVHERPKALLGAKVQAIFGNEFPIRFDFLDTMGGGNLSLQVHPTTDYIQREFGMSYTQNESYYIMDAKPNTHIYLGVKTGAKKAELFKKLQLSQDTGAPFDADEYVNQFPVAKHDHFSIPAGTIHCSGKDTVVLEISQTPYIFTFKLWDWGRVGLDGLPRPVYLEHGRRNVNFEYDTKWVSKNLVSPVETLVVEDGHVEERTGLNDLEAIDTRRHWITGSVEIETHRSVNVLNLVEGEAIRIESINGEFEPRDYHYGETFIVPENIASYRVVNLTPGKKIAVIQAFIRNL